MSEALTDPGAGASADAESEAAAAEAAAAAAATTDPAATPDADAEAAAAAEAAKPKPKRTDRHIAHLTARTAAETDRANAAERRADAAEALLRAGTPDPDKPAPTPRQQPATDVEARAAQLVAERAFNTRLGEINTAGIKDLGADAWEVAKATLTGLGATSNQAFLQALAETENPAKLFAHYADDPDELMEILKKSPAAMAAKLGRMDAELSKPVVKPLSGAPKPAAKVDGGGGAPVRDIYDPKISAKDLDAELDKLLPTHLGGKRKVA